MPPFSKSSEGILFTVYVQPRSSKEAVVGRHGDALKIKLTAPPVDNAANKACIAFLAKQLGVKKTDLDIRSGHTGRTKLVLCRCGASSSGGTDCKTVARTLEVLFS